MRAVHVIPGVWKHTGGPAEVVPRLSQELVRLGCRVTLMTLDGEHSQAALASEDKGVDFRSFPVLGRFGIWYSPRLSQDLRLIISDYDIAHVHGMWLHPNWVSGALARKAGKPYVVTPHGLLGRVHLRRSWLKKKIAWWAIDRRNVCGAACIHLFTRYELSNIRSLAIRRPVCIIANGVDLWKLRSRFALTRQFPHIDGKKVVLFLARVTPAKGIFDLVDAWISLSTEYTQWHLVVVGATEAQCVGHLEKKIQKAGLQSSVTLTGPLYGDQRLNAYSGADVFVLPSYAEGFSTSILEAMAGCLPVVYTEACNFPEAAQRGAGVLSECGVKPLLRNLRRLMSMEDSERRRMGEAGRQLVEAEYTWPQIAAKWLDVYRWLAGTAAKPACVHEAD